MMLLETWLFTKGAVCLNFGRAALFAKPLLQLQSFKSQVTNFSKLTLQMLPLSYINIHISYFPLFRTLFSLSFQYALLKGTFIYLGILNHMFQHMLDTGMKNSICQQEQGFSFPERLGRLLEEPQS